MMKRLYLTIKNRFIFSIVYRENLYSNHAKILL